MGISAQGIFTLVLTANVQGGSKQFLDYVLTRHALVVMPFSQLEQNGMLDLADDELLNVYRGSNLIGTAPSTTVLHALKTTVHLWEKIFVNHMLGFPISILSFLLAAAKRVTSITHDFKWILQKPQPTFKQLRAPGGADRDYLLMPLWPKIELKAQHPTISEIFRMSGANFRSIDVVPMPDYFASDNVSHPAMNTLKIGCIGAISVIKGRDLVWKLSGVADVFVFGFIQGSLKHTPRLQSKGARHRSDSAAGQPVASSTRPGRGVAPLGPAACLEGP
jgi:hypothetical protein